MKMLVVFVTFSLLMLCGQLTNGSLIKIPSESSKFFTQRIIGGEDAPKAYAPHMVALIGVSWFKNVMCGGSIISDRYILTAAHCIDPNVGEDGKLLPTFYGRVGSNIWNSGGTTVEFQSFKNHPKWDSHYIKYDAGLLLLKEKLIFTDKIRPIELRFDRVGVEEAYATGWGNVGPRIEINVVQLAPTPDELQLLYVKTIPHTQCSEEMRAAALLWGWAPHIDPEIELCTFHSVGHGMCNGDSGSALVGVKDGRQVGLVSWGKPCARGAPDVFTRISGMKSFLLNALDSL